VGSQLPLLEAPAGPWTLLDERARGTRFYRIPARGVLNTPEATGMPFWSVNPYIGCEFGCSYCYARDTHRYTLQRAADSGLAPPTLPLLPAAESFERNILVKDRADQLLSRALVSRNLAGQSLVIGSATDPYQPAERRFGITRSLLRCMLPFSGLGIEIITKSPLVLRDTALLGQLAVRNAVRVYVSIATVHRTLARRLEARTAIPSARLRALARLRQAGLDAGVLIAPIIPGITDSAHDLALLLQAARAAGASFAGGSPLRLGPAARRTFLPHLQREFPDLASRYRRAYARHDHAPEAYREALRRRLARLKAQHGFTSGEHRFLAHESGTAAGAQMELLQGVANRESCDL
jgi:DNA repair photolyase